MNRRKFIAGAASTALLSPIAGALSESPALALGVGKLFGATRNRLGTTLQLQLATAPFPHTKHPEWNDPTVWVYVPKHLRVKDKRGIDVILHFHGHRDMADRAMRRHRLRGQLYDSRQNAILVIPQGPVRARSSAFGKLEEPRGLLRFLTELRRTLTHPNVSRELGAAKIPRWARVGRLALSAHSGGYRGVARCLQHGAYPVSEVWLFDALYGDVETFYGWLTGGGDKKRLWCLYRDPTPAKNSLELIERLRKADVRVIHETKEGASSRRELVRATTIFVASRLGHDAMPWRRNAFRDCCLSSGFKRLRTSDWLSERNADRKPRTLERR